MVLDTDVNGVAPGRLDMLGGVADYSGSLVLEVATRCATTCTARLSVDAKAAAAGEAGVAELWSEGFCPEGGKPLELSLAPLGAGGAAVSLPAVRAWLRAGCGRGADAEPAPGWAVYLFGSLASFSAATSWVPPMGARLSLRVRSSVPTAQGVSSSASVECAVMRALRTLSGATLSDLALAHAAQAAENHVVGAPCGLMDQLASMLGSPGRVLPILCRPDMCEPPVALPEGVALVGWPSGVKHSVADSPYLVARTATFMGRRMAEVACGLTLSHATALAPSTLRRDVLPVIPTTITGADFVAKYGPLSDSLSSVDPKRTYNVAAALTFAVDENFRCATALSLLRALDREAGSTSCAATHDALAQVGELMLQAHEAYTSIGLGAPQTDTIVRALAAAGPSAGIYGARVSGGGSGGTVVVLCRRDALPRIQEMAEAIIFDNVPFTKLIE